MAHSCPRCGQPVQRGYNAGTQLAAGLIGALFYAAFGSFQCKGCGKIVQSEFPADVRTKIALQSVLMVLGAIALAGFCLWLMSEQK